jgi:hypothetical protein
MNPAKVSHDSEQHASISKSSARTNSCLKCQGPQHLVDRIRPLGLGHAQRIAMDQVNEAIVSAINTYHELNAALVDELTEEPSPLEFMRLVASNRPFVVRKAAREWKAIQSWDAVYLLEVMGDASVEVAVTPQGCEEQIQSNTLR